MSINTKIPLSLMALAVLGSMHGLSDGYAPLPTGHFGTGWDREKRSPEASAMLQQKAQAKRERKAAILAARVTI